MIRYGASPGTVEALERMNMAIDLREVLPVVSAPRAPMARAPTATHVYGPRGPVAPRSEVKEHAGIAQRVGLHSVEVEELGDPLVIGAEQFLINLV
jgi:hypothetical protein